MTDVLMGSPDLGRFMVLLSGSTALILPMQHHATRTVPRHKTHLLDCRANNLSQAIKGVLERVLAISNRKHPLADYANPFSLAIRSTTFCTYAGRVPLPLTPSSRPAQMPL